MLPGVSNAPPVPWKILATISWTWFCEIPAIKEEMEKIKSPMRNILFRPNLSPMEPPTSSKEDRNKVYPLMIHKSCVPVIPRSDCNAGRATFKAVLSRNTRLDARIVDKSVHFWTGVNAGCFDLIRCA